LGSSDPIMMLLKFIATSRWTLPAGPVSAGNW